MKGYQSWITLLGRLILGGTLLAAGSLKIGNPHDAAASVRVYELLPVSLANTLGYSLPWIEIGLALFLIFGIWVRQVAITSGALMAIFIVAIGQAWIRKLPINCGCFGNGGITADGKVHGLTYFTEIVRDFALVAIAYYLYRFPQGKLGLDKFSIEDLEESKQGE